MSDSWDDRSDGYQIESLEAAIRAAGNYIRPSDDLRPRTLEAARQVAAQRRAEQKLGRLAIAALLMALITAPLLDAVGVWRSSMTSPSATQIQTRAVELEADANVGTHWGLAEAFTRLRRLQADRFASHHHSLSTGRQ